MSPAWMGVQDPNFCPRPFSRIESEIKLGEEDGFLSDLLSLFCPLFDKKSLENLSSFFDFKFGLSPSLSRLFARATGSEILLLH